MRLIDAEELFNKVGKIVPRNTTHYKAIGEFMNMITNSSTIEPKQGEWIYCEDEEGQDGYRCSECGFFVPWYYSYEDINFIYKYHICPSCMARMKGTDDDY